MNLRKKSSPGHRKKVRWNRHKEWGALIHKDSRTKKRRIGFKIKQEGVKVFGSRKRKRTVKQRW